MRAGRKYGAMVGITPTVTGPDAEDCLSVTSSLAARSSLRMVRARGRKSCPRSVSLTARPSRSKRRTPSSSSSLMICCESEGWATCSRAAARVKLPVSATAQKYRSWWTSIDAAYEEKSNYILDIVCPALYFCAPGKGVRWGTDCRSANTPGARHACQQHPRIVFPRRPAGQQTRYRAAGERRQGVRKSPLLRQVLSHP